MAFHRIDLLSCLRSGVKVISRQDWVEICEDVEMHTADAIENMDRQMRASAQLTREDRTPIIGR